MFGDSQFTSTLSVNFHFPKIPRRTYFYALYTQRRAESALVGHFLDYVIEALTPS